MHARTLGWPHGPATCGRARPLHCSAPKLQRKKNPHFRQRPKAWLQGDGEISNIKHGMSNARRGQIQYQQVANTVEYTGGSRQTINSTQHATASAKGLLHVV